MRTENKMTRVPIKKQIVQASFEVWVVAFCRSNLTHYTNITWCYRVRAVTVSPHHLLECHLHQLLDSLVWVLLCGLPDEAVLQHMKHFLPWDVVVTAEVVHIEAVCIKRSVITWIITWDRFLYVRVWQLTFNFFIQGPSEENAKSFDPLFLIHKAVVVFVKCAEDWKTDNQWYAEHTQVIKQPRCVQSAAGY